jgi:hypothetical protein
MFPPRVEEKATHSPSGEYTDVVADDAGGAAGGQGEHSACA